ncbi:hypothetical protein U1Q18_038004, partial [Sarracenia purpurea var. burkii]
MVSSSPHVNHATNEDRGIILNHEVRVSPSRMSSNAFQAAKHGSSGVNRDGGFQSKNKAIPVALSGNEVGTSDDLYANATREGKESNIGASSKSVEEALPLSALVGLVLEGDNSQKAGTDEALATGEGAEVESDDPSAVIAMEGGTVNESEDQIVAIESGGGPRTPLTRSQSVKIGEIIQMEDK